jgi:biopolymer transport protein ExbD
MGALDKAQENIKMDMTPMIDCVFLLMIFFVLVIDLSQTELEDLILPKAQYAVPDDKPPENRPVVNVMQDGLVKYRRNVYHDPVKDGLENYQRVKNDLLPKLKAVSKDITPENLGGRTVQVINDPILIRADKWTEWYHVGKFMENCITPEAAFWKIELAMSEKDKEEVLLKAARR